MEQELDQVVQAITIASDPAQAALHQQALNYLGTIQQNAENTWRLALPLFVDAGADGVRKYPPQVRFFALRVLDEFFDNRFEPLDDESFGTIQQSLVGYIQSEYIYGPAEANSTFLRNKFSHTLTLFFLCTYITQWPAFFSDLFSLIRPAQSSSSSQPAFNRHIILLFFHIVLEISGEVADATLKSARPFNQDRHTRDGRVRDAVRERDAAGINEAVLTIVSDGTETIKKRDASPRDLETAVEVVDLGIRTFGSYVGWIDINLTVTPTTVPLLFSLLADPSLPIRLATSAALTRIVAKGLKEPGDKLQLLKVLSLGQVIDALESKTRTEQIERSETDEGEEAYREALGKLLNILGLELMKLIEDETTSDDVASEASLLLAQTLPVILRFMADDYDDTCCTVFPLLQTILGSYKRSRKLSSEPLDDSKRSFLTSLLQVILVKLKWEEETDLEDPDEDDIAEFEGLRKDLRNLMDHILAVDQDLVTDAVRSLALNTIGAFQSGIAVSWNDAELGVYLVYIFGEINKGIKGRTAFCHAPPLDKDKDKRKTLDYSQFPLSPQGEMMFALVQSNISSYPHRSVTLQFFETVARYPEFFKVRKECIMPTLEAMIDTRGLHNSDASHRSRVYYLFHRFIKELRLDIPADVAVNIASSIRDLLPIEVQIPDVDDSESSANLLSEAIKSSAFDSQLYLYETVGTLCALLAKTPDQLASLLLSFVKPLMSELSDNLQAYRTKGSQDLIPIVKVHHVIMALGNVAKGFPEYPTPVPAGYVPLPLDVFAQVAQAILVCLEAMNVFKDVRDASRFAFARILATTGPNVTHFIPQLMANLLTQFEPSELVDFLNFIGLLIHKLQTDLFNVLDELISPLSAHITGLLTQPISGTDDQRVHLETMKAFLALLNSVLASKLQGIFVSEKNRGGFDSLMETMLRIASDISDPVSAKAALVFLNRSITIWGQPLSSATNGAAGQHSLPGFEQYVYERFVTTAFRIPSLPEFNLKDPGLTPVLHEIANLLQTVFKTRGTEAYDYFVGVFLPSQGWPAETALDFTGKVRDLDAKAFRKYFTEFVRSSRSES
ncbi:armadillo-type protein [Mycena crocata]|nr:armadillo-type protein [Mycena crocata]